MIFSLPTAVITVAIFLQILPAIADNVISPIVSYQYYQSLGEAPTSSITSPIISYQYFDQPDVGSMQFLNSLPVSYLYQVGNGSPFVIIDPISQPSLNGSNVTFNVLADGQLPLTYQWLFNGKNIFGATNTALKLINVMALNSGGYSVTISNTYGFTNSAVAQLDINTPLLLIQTNKAPPSPGISTIPTDTNHFKVFANGNFVNGIGLNPNIDTVVLTHGWNDSSTNWPLETANIIDLELGSSCPNIVAWDWTVEASGSITASAYKTQGQGYALGTNLIAALGSNYSQRIHFIGHSLGTLVNAKAANYVHANGFSWTNTQMTLFDEAETAWGLYDGTWQTVTTLLQNDSDPQQDWKHPLPDQCAWADNYITAFGLPHSQAVNVILTNLYPATANIHNSFDFVLAAFLGQFQTDDTIYHEYPYIWYENTIINDPNAPTDLMGFLRSWEGGGYSERPATNSFYIQSTNAPAHYSSYPDYDPNYNLVQITSDEATQFLNNRLQNLFSQVGVNIVSSSANISANAPDQVQAYLQSGQILYPYSDLDISIQYGSATLVKLATIALANHSLVQNGKAHPLGGPVPTDDNNGSPVYVWIPVTVPSNAISMSFEFMLQGNGSEDSFQVSLNNSNLFTIEAMLIQTNITMNSGLLDVSQYAGQQTELFFGIVGGTSTNANITVSDIAFYVTAAPILQIQIEGTNVTLSWPLSAANYGLEATTNPADVNSWTVVTNEPSIINYRNTLTNNILGVSCFYRLYTQ